MPTVDQRTTFATHALTTWRKEKIPLLTAPLSAKASFPQTVSFGSVSVVESGELKSMGKGDNPLVYRRHLRGRRLTNACNARGEPPSSTRTNNIEPRTANIESSRRDGAAKNTINEAKKRLTF